ncbi:MAG: hypothetical protein WAU78_13065 [Roseiarcus sp.]
MSIAREARFPKLNRTEYCVTSDETPDYNCIAHAADKNDNWWWPDDQPAYWPQGLDKVETLEAFVSAYATLGYAKCEGGGTVLEAGFEKVVIYADTHGVPTHAAKQLPNGAWTSKLGEWEDIQHTRPEAMEDDGVLGLGYGKIAVVLKRKVA